MFNRLTAMYYSKGCKCSTKSHSVIMIYTYTHEPLFFLTFYYLYEAFSCESDILIVTAVIHQVPLTTLFHLYIQKNNYYLYTYLFLQMFLQLVTFAINLQLQLQMTKRCLFQSHISVFDDSRQYKNIRLLFKSTESLMTDSIWCNVQIINYIITSTFPDTISDLYM